MIKEIRQLDICEEYSYIRVAVPFSYLPDSLQENIRNFISENDCTDYLDEIVNGCVELQDFNMDNTDGNIEVVYYFDDYKTISIIEKDSELGMEFAVFIDEHRQEIALIADEIGDAYLGDAEFMELNSVKALNQKLEEEYQISDEALKYEPDIDR